MSLAEGKEVIEVNETDFIDTTAAIERWQHFPASVILHHGKRCCQIAREWVFSIDYSQLNGEHTLAGPRWIRQRFQWGPSNWPISWCEAVEQKTLDCGALAAVANEGFTARGVPSYPTQLIQQYDENATHHWQRKWGADEASVHWIKEDLIYHEGCAVVSRDNEIKVWDPTASWWVNPKQFGGYGGLILIRVFAPQTESSSIFNWGSHTIVANRWQKIERAQGDFA